MKTNLKILFVSQYFYPEQFSNNSIAQYLTRAGHEVKVVSCVPNYPQGEFFTGYSNKDKRREEWNGISIHRARTVPRGKSALSLIRNFLTFPVTGSWTARKAAADADVSFVSMPSPLFQAFVGVFMRWRRGIPTVYWVQDLWPDTVFYTLGLKSPLICRPLSWLCGWLYRRADLILVQSQAFVPTIEKFGVSSDRIHLYPNSAPESYVPMPKRDHPLLGQPAGKERFRIMFAGNIGESQDFDTIIECAERLKHQAELEWIIVGSGRDQARVEAEIASRGLQECFNFIGRHPEGDMPDLFAQADVMLVTLKRNPVFALTVPYKIQCYMACGKPIVAALDGEGSRILKESKAGKAVPSSDPEKLAEAVLKLLSLDKVELENMGRNARTYYEHNYAAEQVNSKLDTWLRQIAGR